MAPKNAANYCLCKFCKRSNRDTPNPWLPPDLRGDKEMLQFRRQRGRECCSCSALIRTRKRDFYDDPELETVLENDESKRDMFDQDLEEFEAQKREAATTRSMRGSTKKLEAHHTSGFKMRMVLGYFWPVDVLRRENKEVPKNLTSITYNGRNIKGAVLDPSHGTPIGVIEMENYDDKGVSKVTCTLLARSVLLRSVMLCCVTLSQGLVLDIC